MNVNERIHTLMNEIRNAASDNNSLDCVMSGLLWDELTGLLSDVIKTKGISAESESEIAFEVDHRLVSLSEIVLEPAGYDGYVPLRENTIELVNDENGEKYSIQNITRRGRIDSKYSNFIIEYKKHEKYKNIADVEKAKKQAISYLKALDSAESNTYVALITDGIRCQFIEWIDGKPYVEDIINIDARVVDRIIKSIIKLSVRELSAKNLIEDLVVQQIHGTNIINKFTKELYQSLATMSDNTIIAYESWLDNFNLSHDDASQQQAIENDKKGFKK